jgi:hypothetical protein
MERFLLCENSEMQYPSKCPMVRSRYTRHQASRTKHLIPFIHLVFF